MKKIALVISALALTLMVAAPASAQKKNSSKSTPWYVGGSVGVTYSSANDGQGNGENSKQSGASYRLLPEVGYKINKKMAAGVQVGLVKGIGTFGSFDPSDVKTLGLTVASAALDIASDINFGGGGGVPGAAGPTKITGFRFAPYFRYTLLSNSKFDFFVDGMFAFTRAARKAYGPDPNGNGNTWQGTNYNLIEVAARPGFLVKFTPKFNVICRVGALGLQRAKQQDSEAGVTRFGLDMDTNNLMLGFVFNL